MLKVTWTPYLNKSMDVTTCHSIEGHPREDFEILSSDNPMSPVHRQPLVTPNGGRTGVDLLLLFRRQTRSFGDRSRKLFNWSRRRSRPRRLRARGDESNWSSWNSRRTPPSDAHHLFPYIRQWLILFRPHLSVHVLVELSCHLCKRNEYKKKKKSVLNVRAALTSLRLTLFSFNVKIPQDEGRGLRTKTIKSKSPRIHKVVPTLNHARILNSLLPSFSVPAFQLRPCLNCSKRET